MSLQQDYTYRTSIVNKSAAEEIKISSSRSPARKIHRCYEYIIRFHFIPFHRLDNLVLPDNNFKTLHEVFSIV